MNHATVLIVRLFFISSSFITNCVHEESWESVIFGYFLQNAKLPISKSFSKLINQNHSFISRNHKEVCFKDVC